MHRKQASNQMKKIPLYGRGSEGQYALVDDDVADLPFIRNYRWQFNDGRPSLGLGIVLARKIMQAPPHLEVDHINHDTLDNRRANLRLSTHAENQANKRPQSPYGYKGVSFQHNGWVAKIGIYGTSIYLGRFRRVEDAAVAYDIAAIQLQGDFAFLNIIGRRS